MTLRAPITDDDIEDYISGQLDAPRRREVEAFLREDPVRLAEVQAQIDLEQALRRIGEDLLDEPVPDRFLRLLEDDAPEARKDGEMTPPDPEADQEASGSG